MQSYESIRNLYEDPQVVRDMQTTFGEIFLYYFERHGQREEYEFEELEEIYLLLDWIACQLSFHRPIKTKQLFIYGVPNMRRTALFHILSRVLRIRIYFASSRGDDLTGAHNYYDLWVFDSSHEPKDERVFHKKANVPIVMIANKLQASMRDQGPFRARYIRMRISSNIHDLDEGRIFAKLWGCIRRRVRNSPFAFFSTTPNHVHLDYNYCEGYFIPYHLDSQERSFRKDYMDSYLQFAKEIGL